MALVGVKQIRVKNRPTDVTVLRDSELIRWLHKQPEVLAPDLRVRLARLATNPSTWGGETLVPDLAAFDVIRRTVDGARRVRLAWGSTLLLLVLASLLSTGAMHFGLLG